MLVNLSYNLQSDVLSNLNNTDIFLNQSTQSTFYATLLAPHVLLDSIIKSILNLTYQNTIHFSDQIYSDALKVLYKKIIQSFLPQNQNESSDSIEEQESPGKLSILFTIYDSRQPEYRSDLTLIMPQIKYVHTSDKAVQNVQIFWGKRFSRLFLKMCYYYQKFNPDSLVYFTIPEKKIDNLTVNSRYRLCKKSAKDLLKTFTAKVKSEI